MVDPPHRTPPEDPTDNQVQLDFYYHQEDINALPCYHTITELLDFDTSVVSSGSHLAHQELEYTPPWIDDDLLKYSLKGLYEKENLG